MILRSPVTLPLLAFGTPKPVPPDPRAHDTFRVTQRFDDPDFFFRDGRLHRALDIGNFRCGEPVVASADGTLRRGTDQHGGRFIIVDHAGGWQTAYWHLNDWSVPQGAAVKRGQQIGILGRTGLGNVCHLHFEARRNGVHVDPWPLLEQNQEGDMKLQGTWRENIGRSSSVVAEIGARLRSGPNLQSAVLAVLPKGTRNLVIARVTGEVVSNNANWYPVLTVADGERLFGYLHSTVHQLDPPVDCAKEVAAATLAFTNRLNGIRTAATGAAQAIEAVRKAAE